MTEPREFKCLFDPETKELTYGHRHGCTDGFESIHVREVMPQAEGEPRSKSEMKRLDHTMRAEIDRLRNRVAELEKYKLMLEVAEGAMQKITSCCESCTVCASCEMKEAQAKIEEMRAKK